MTYEHLGVGECSRCGTYRNQWRISDSVERLCQACITGKAHRVTLGEGVEPRALLNSAQRREKRAETKRRYQQANRDKVAMYTKRYRDKLRLTNTTG